MKRPNSLFRKFTHQVNRLISLTGRQLIHHDTLSQRIFPDRNGLAHLDFRHAYAELIAPEKASCCIDVGANVGQTALRFRRYFPNCHVYSFEPVSSTFRQLLANTSHDPRISCFQYAVSDRPEIEIPIFIANDSQCNSRLQRDGGSSGVETATSISIDRFCSTNHLASVDLLKSDTEGFDLDVLRGAEESLASGVVKAAYVEVTFDPRDASHSNFFEIAPFLDAAGFSFYALFEQSTRPNPHRLFYANALFVSKRFM